MRLLRDAEATPEAPTWRAKVKLLPDLDHTPLRPAQIEAINGIERSLAEQRFDRSLVQMATGAGKTYAAVTEAYRLLKYGSFNRILFLADRNNLADQTQAEFQNYRPPDPPWWPASSSHLNPWAKPDVPTPDQMATTSTRSSSPSKSEAFRV